MKQIQVQISIEPQIGFLIYWGKGWSGEYYFGIDFLFIDINFRMQKK